MTNWFDVILHIVSPAYTLTELGLDAAGDALTTPLLTGKHLERAAAGAAILGAAALAPIIYPYVAPKARSKRSKARRAKDEAAVKELGEVTQKGISKAFTTSAFALPATFLLLEVLASYPKGKVVHHPAEGYWVTQTYPTTLIGGT